MPAGALTISLRGASTNQSMDDSYEIRLRPLGGAPGGSSMQAAVALRGKEPSCRITNIPCLDTGTAYTVEVRSGHFDVESFAQIIFPREQAAPKLILMVNPSRVGSIARPRFTELPDSLQDALSNAALDDIVTKGEQLYHSLGNLDCACLLNVSRKAAFGTSLDVWNFVTAIRRIDQDRVFVNVEPSIRLRLSPTNIPPDFKPVGDSLHQPLSGYRKVDSFKSKDDHANLQVTFMQHTETHDWAADIDIDEASGFRHAIEVLRNGILKRKTNPYEIHQLLTRYRGDRDQEPGYSLVFA